MSEKLYPKGKVIMPPKTFVENAPPPEQPAPAPAAPPVVQSKEEAAPRVIVFDRNQAAIDAAAEKAKAKPVLSAQTKAEMEAGRQALRRLQGLE